MSLITSSDDLAALCERLAGQEFVAVDTEFMRESTFWPILCLVQLSAPEVEPVAVDPMAPEIDLAPLHALMADQRVMKVFHAARQDVEIFYQLGGAVPRPIFDTQIAAMVCGFGESVSYEILARKLAGKEVDKASRFTDWSKRPLTARQVAYALGDVDALTTIYRKLSRRLAKSGRASWLDEEMAVLTDPATYEVDPDLAWRRIRTRNAKPRFLAILREVAAVRERAAQERNVPRNRVIRDEALLEIAAQEPETIEELARTRGLGRGLVEGRVGQALLEAVARGRELPEDERPHRRTPAELPRGSGALVDLLKVLLKLRCEEQDVAQKLVASVADLELVAAGETDVPALKGWRRELFGADAEALCAGRLALAAEKNRAKVIRLDD